MKKYILMLLVALLPITSIFAQTHKDSVDTYNELKEWAVVKLTIAYIEDYKGWSPDTKNGDSEQEFNTYKDLSTTYNNTDESINLEEVGDLLIDGGWETTKIKVFDNYKAQLIDSNLYNYSNIQPFGYNENIKNSNFERTLSSIISNYDNLLPKEVITKEDVSIEPTSFNENNKRRIGKDMGSLVYILGGVILLLIAFIIYIYNKSRNIDSLNDDLKRIRKERDSLKKEKDNLFYNASNSNKAQNSPNGAEFQDLKNENKRLNTEVKQLKDQINQITNNSSIQSDNENYPVVEFDNIDPIKRTTTIYLPRPQDEKIFLNKHAKYIKDDRYLYEVTFDESLGMGSLKLIEGSDFARALSSPERYLEKACSYDNEYSNNVRDVKVTEKGEIRLEGEDWIVTKKVRIKFI